MTSIGLIVGNSQGILDQQLKPRPIHLLNTNVILIDYISIYCLIIKLKTEEMAAKAELELSKTIKNNKATYCFLSRTREY
jgi:hypothetical protein